MRRMFYQKNIWFYFLVFISLILLIGEIINQRFYSPDLEVYYKSASRLWQGEELYRIKADGHYVFKYSPTSAFYFIPLLVLPFSAAKIVYWFLLTFLAGYVLNAYYKLTTGPEVNKSAFQKNRVLFLAFLGVGVHIHREWHLGQVNLLLLALYVLMLHLFIQKRYKTASFILAFSLFIKPFGLIFLPYFFLKKKYLSLGFTILLVLILGLLPLIFYPGLADFKALYLSWFRELAIELAAKQGLLQEGNHTIFSVLGRYTPLKLLLIDAKAARIFQLIILAGIGVLLLYFIRKGRSLPQPAVAEGAVLIGLIPLFAFTSLNAFLFLLPCIVFLLYHFGHLPTGGKIALVLSCVLIGGNIRDLVGAAAFKVLENHSVYSFGALTLLVLMFYLRLKMVRKELESKN
ncbi:MAG: hypothetical protein JWQ14_883 [Adhaeribacter sp.]|nr:hypothetical protein [Adhaeribacter sp.]